MNIRQRALTLSLIALLGSAPLQAGGRNAPFPGQTTTATATELNTTEAEELLFMREEEKLARDIYLNAYEKWRYPVFLNISRAEQSHMDTMASKLESHGLEDPVTDDTVGVFANEELAALFQQLDAATADSLIEALKTGALIEETDIADLQQAIEDSTHPDVTLAYENLLRGSRNHLRAFVRQIEALGDAYEPEILSPEEVDAILEQPMERGGRGGRGPGGKRGGHGRGMGR
ncbi:MAG TPA: DUF2202 domain-containing protein [Sedimenticola sp.]|nr:DUF2202 domain-containing protein [Sedimenticola sp.]